MAAVRAIADLARRPVPDIVNRAYHVRNFTFGPDYFIPKPVDPRLITEVSMAVAKAAMDSGVARKISGRISIMRKNTIGDINYTS